MFGSFKRLVFAVLAVAVIGAVSASAVQAGDFTVGTPSAGNAIITMQTDVNIEIKVGSGIIRCTTFSIPETTVQNGATTIEITPGLAGCKAFGVNATVDTEGCHLIFHITGTVGSGATTLDVECTEAKEVTVTPVGINCIIHIPSQTGLTGLTLDNAVNPATTKDDLTLTLNIHSIKYTETGLSCFTPNTPQTNGTLTGSLTINGFADETGKEGAPIHIWRD
jgi:hypothetical protein